MEKEEGGQGLLFKMRGGNKSVAGFKNVARDIFEKTKRLRRKTVPLTSQTMQGKKNANGFEAVAELNPHTFVFRLADAAPDGAVESFEEDVGTGIKIDDMTVKNHRRFSGQPLVTIIST